jgi:hypothetical protein
MKKATHRILGGCRFAILEWLLDNTPMPGATNASLILKNVLGKHTGAYRMVVSNALGTASSEIANIAIPCSTPIWRQR